MYEDSIRISGDRDPQDSLLVSSFPKKTTVHYSACMSPDVVTNLRWKLPLHRVK